MGDRIIEAGPNGGIPNHPRWGALVRPGAAGPGLGADAGRRLVEANGWGGSWVWTVFDYHHFHPDAHEALLCIAGRATIRLGGEEGTDVDVGLGDGMILPAGFGHRMIQAEDGFRVVGAYPPGQDSPAVLRARPGEEATFRQEVALLRRPATDPFTGRDFPGEWAD